MKDGWSTKPGKPDCPDCHGEGVVRFQAGGIHPPTFKRCKCVLQKDIAANVERGMRKLMEAPAVKSSRLFDYIGKDLWITAPRDKFTAHLRHVAIRQPPTWYFKVITDADLMTAWLASVAFKGEEILDPDAVQVSLTHLTLVDLITPPQLLIIRLGVKVARNVATPEVFLEALYQREHAGLPTWVWDTPDAPLGEGHRCWSPAVMDSMSSWQHVVMQGSAVRSNTGFSELGLSSPAPTLSSMGPAARPSLSDTTRPKSRKK